MKDNPLVTLSKKFAVDIIEFCSSANNSKYYVMYNQILKSGTSIGANIHEANYAASKADFVNKFQIALKECYETDYWLSLFHDANIIEESVYDDLFSQCSKIRRLLISSINTSKQSAL